MSRLGLTFSHSQTKVMYFGQEYNRSESVRFSLHVLLGRKQINKNRNEGNAKFSLKDKTLMFSRKNKSLLTEGNILGHWE